MKTILTLLVGRLLVGTVAAIEPTDPRLAIEREAESRQWVHSLDGGCGQSSNGMCGVDKNVTAAATLLWDTDYGRRVRGGSGPSRVAGYCQKRNLRIYNITGRNTWEWMRWASATGRGAAIGAGRAHFQTLFGHDPRTGTWWVCNNNSPRRIDEYDDAGFRRLHLASGQWVVILDYPPHPARPKYVRWW